MTKREQPNYSDSKVNKKWNELMRFCNTPRTRQEMQDFMKLKDKKNFVNNYIQPMIRLGIIEISNPDKPTGKNQMYATTEQNF